MVRIVDDLRWAAVRKIDGPQPEGRARSRGTKWSIRVARFVFGPILGQSPMLNESCSKCLIHVRAR
jgi:hypothetical protein